MCMLENFSLMRLLEKLLHLIFLSLYLMNFNELDTLSY